MVGIQRWGIVGVLGLVNGAQCAYRASDQGSEDLVERLQVNTGDSEHTPRLGMPDSRLVVCRYLFQTKSQPRPRTGHSWRVRV